MGFLADISGHFHKFPFSFYLDHFKFPFIVSDESILHLSHPRISIISSSEKCDFVFTYASVMSVTPTVPLVGFTTPKVNFNLMPSKASSCEAKIDWSVRVRADALGIGKHG